MKSISLLLLILVFAMGTINAQYLSDSSNTFLNTELKIGQIYSLNTNRIEQMGNYNEANIYQMGNTVIFPNATEILQQGEENYAYSNQIGNSNLTTIAQFGSNNSAQINVVGNYNFAGVQQIGSGNSVQQDLIGDGLNFLIYQEGSGNLINQVQTEPIFMPLQIHQTGNGMRLMIINGGIH